MKKLVVAFAAAVLLFACDKEDDKPVKPATEDPDFVVVEGTWNLEYRHYTLYDSLHQKLAETKQTIGPGNWLTFKSGGVFQEFENGRLAYSGTFTNENNILTINALQETHVHTIDTLTLNRLVYHEKLIYPNKDYHIYRTAAKK